MRIMVVNNNVIYEADGGLYVYKETGKFFVDLAQEGNDVTVFQFRMRSEGSDFLADFNLQGKGLRIVAVKRRSGKLWAYVKAFFIGFNTVRKSDFVYLFYPGQICSMLAFFCLILHKKYGFYVRGEKGILSAVPRYLYRHAQVNLTISPRFTEKILSIGALAHTIRPMMDFSETDMIMDRNYPAKNTYELLFVGRIERDKGVYEIVEAFEILRNAGVNHLKIHLVGDGVDYNTIQELIAEKQLEATLILHGTLTDRAKLSAFYATSDAFLLPTHHEGFPRVLYEAMIFGTPILTSFVGSIPYLMKDKHNCIRIEVRDPDQLARTLQEFFREYEKNAIIARRGTQTLLEYLSDKKDKHAVQLLKFIRTN